MSSRIIVRNLPKHISESRFRSHFDSKGEITDVKLVYTSTGKFRRFGYIGYRSEQEAQDALAFFNNTFIDTSKVYVEIAKPRGDVTLPRAWSIYTQGTSLYNKSHGIKNAKADALKKQRQQQQKEKTQNAIRTLYDELLVGNQEDPRFKEFLQVMAPRVSNRAWTNDDYANWNVNELSAVKDAVAARREQVENNTDRDETKGEAITDKDADDVSSEQGVDSNKETQSVSAPVSDMEWLRMHMESKMEDDEEHASEGEVEKTDIVDKSENAGVVSEMQAEDTDPTVLVASAISQINETGRLFVRNLPYMATEEDIRQVFEAFGPLSEVHIPISKDTKRPKGFAYVLYLLPEHAVNAFKALDNQVFLGRLLHVLPGKEKPQPREQDDALGGFKSSVKKERDAKKKALAGSSFNWNSLYMSADAVADSISARLDISKADLLSADSAGNPAVRLALAETHVVNDAKQFFENHGVLIDRFGEAERSDVVILVKNIPFSVDEDELRALFGKHGNLGRVLLPPSRTIAIVEFLEPSEARAAFRHLAYKRLKDAPIYLERAPEGIFETSFDASAHEAPKEQRATALGSKAQLEAIHESVTAAGTSSTAVGGDGEKGQVGCVLFIKNLNFETTEDTLRPIFNGVDGLASVLIRRKRDTKNQNSLKSMGFGFVEYKTPAAAQKALDSYQGIEVDGHALMLKMSDRVGKAGANDGTDTLALEGKQPRSTKLVIKNVPFEATRKDIHELVSAFGQIKSVRLPKKFSGGHRGFAFVDFLTPQEAQHVLDTMKSTHLYGRHLVLGWAEEESSLQAIREKVGRQFAKDNDEGSASLKRRKIEMGHSRGSDESEMDEDDSDDN
ncbi:Multiple RNA-binding domain-containing protein 1 [Coemansia sp. RSA 1365]|nr:Multiple RNA-binding domain-containing protein 1 [Coemansia sp. RSA 1365]